jgi:streptogramin lyase
MSWLHSLFGRRTKHTLSRKRPISRPGLECLETRFLLATGITEFATLPNTSSQPDAVTTGPDGNIWFTEIGHNGIGRIAEDGTLLGETVIPTSNSQPAAITVGPDGNIWFTEQTGNKIGRITPNGTLTEFTLPAANSQPLGITAGPDGNVWFVESTGNRIGHMATGGTLLGETDVTPFTANSLPIGITSGPDGNLWFTEANGAKIGRITPTGVITEFSGLTAGSFPTAITVGPDGNLWFTEPNANKIGRITVSGAISEFTVPTPSSQPNGIATGPDGNLWFTELGTSRIGQITPAGLVAAEFIVPTANSMPNGIAVGPHSSLVFAEFGQAANRLATVHDVIDANHSFIQGLYQDALGRLGSPAELDGWVVNIVSSGIGPVVRGIERSAEAHAHLLRTWYVRFLGRTTPPADSEIQGWLSAFQAGATEEQVLGALLASQEFFNFANRLISAGTPNERFVSAVYVLLLNRTPTSGEVQGWVGQLPVLGQQGIANNFLNSAEYRGDIIQGYYSTLLHRSSAPSAAEVNGWVVSGMDLERIRIGFETSLEFYLKG